jgi:dephospho-CoA kinase
LKRGVLAQRVFGDPEARRQLEAILHPRIRNLWITEVLAWRKEGKPICVVVIPLLFETSAQKELSSSVCVACSTETQHKRLAARGWSAEQIRQRAQAQWPIQQKLRPRILWCGTKQDWMCWTHS